MFMDHATDTHDAVADEDTDAATQVESTTGQVAAVAVCSDSAEDKTTEDQQAHHARRGVGRAISFEARGPSAILPRLCTREKRLAMPPAELQLLESFKDLLVRLLSLDPSHRMTAAAALRHPFFTAPDPVVPDKTHGLDTSKVTMPTRVREGRGFN